MSASAAVLNAGLQVKQPDLFRLFSEPSFIDSRVYINKSLCTIKPVFFDQALSFCAPETAGLNYREVFFSHIIRMLTIPLKRKK